MKFKVPPKYEKLFDVAKFVIGLIALVVGIAGLLFPIMPGWLFIFVGLELLGIKIVFFDKIKEYALKKIEESKKKNK